jgi:hypothetical protein
MIMEFTFYPYVEKNLDKVEERWGVYKLADHSKRILFIGRGNVRKHLYDHLPGAKAPAEGAEYFSVEFFDTRDEAVQAWTEQVQEHRAKFGELPKYNS